MERGEYIGVAADMQWLVVRRLSELDGGCGRISWTKLANNGVISRDMLTD